MYYYLHVGDPNIAYPVIFIKHTPDFHVLFLLLQKKSFYLNILLCFQILCIWITPGFILVSDILNLIYILKSLSTSPVPWAMLQARTEALSVIEAISAEVWA